LKNPTLKKFLKFVKVNESKISTFLGLIVILFVVIIAFKYFRSVNQTSQSEPTITPTPTNEEVKLSTDENGVVTPEGLPKTYTVQKGDNLWKIAENNYTSGYNWVDIARENNLKNPGRIFVGQELTLPKTEVITITKGQITPKAAVSITGDTYTIQKGDNLWKVAVAAYGDGYQWTQIAQANDLKNPGLIFAGDTLKLPR